MADDEPSADPPPTRLVLIRHGESNATVARTIGGPRTCSGLSDLGRDQAGALRARLSLSGELRDAHVYASHYPRAIETAEIIAPALGGSEVIVDDGFGEHDPGPDCDGLSFQEFIDRYGMPDWESDPYAVTFPGGETLAQFRYRVGEAVARVTRTHPGETIVVCCHGGVVDAVMRIALHAHGQYELFTSNTSITELLLVRPGRWRLQRYNDACHLTGLPPATN